MPYRSAISTQVITGPFEMLQAMVNPLIQALLVMQCGLLESPIGKAKSCPKKEKNKAHMIVEL